MYFRKHSPYYIWINNLLGTADKMSAFILSYMDKISFIIFGLYGIFAIYLLKRNSKLAETNQDLKQEISDTQKALTIQNKVIDATSDTKPADFTGFIDRMRQNKL